MCGRFALHLQAGALLDIFGCLPPDGLDDRYNTVPDGEIVVIVAGSESRCAGRLRWGLLPPWADAPNDRGRQINARSETVFEKPGLKSAALRPLPEELLAAYPVSRVVNSPANDHPDLVLPENAEPERAPAQGALF
jgi:putative SOS response-associated peptidase YedK